MLPDEAALIGRWARQLQLSEESTCLNVGSSTREFREQTQPFIHENILLPISETGCRIINCDMKEDDGVDEVGDLLDPVFQRKLIEYKPDLIICSNLLEHLSDPLMFAQACGAIVKPGGYCLFTVPRSFPYHPDPLDTMYRPAPSELMKLLPDWQVVEAQELTSSSYREELRNTALPMRTLMRHVVRVMMPFYRPRTWYPAAHKLLWLFRPYCVSLVMLKKPEHT